MTPNYLPPPRVVADTQRTPQNESDVPLLTLEASNMQVQTDWDLDSTHKDIFVITDGVLYLTPAAENTDQDTTVFVTIYAIDEFKTLNDAYANLTATAVIQVDLLSKTVYPGDPRVAAQYQYLYFPTEDVLLSPYASPQRSGRSLAEEGTVPITIGNVEYTISDSDSETFSLTFDIGAEDMTTSFEGDAINESVDTIKPFMGFDEDPTEDFEKSWERYTVGIRISKDSGPNGDNHDQTRFRLTDSKYLSKASEELDLPPDIPDIQNGQYIATNESKFVKINGRIIKYLDRDDRDIIIDLPWATAQEKYGMTPPFEYEIRFFYGHQMWPLYYPSVDLDKSNGITPTIFNKIYEGEYGGITVHTIRHTYAFAGQDDGKFFIVDGKFYNLFHYRTWVNPKSFVPERYVIYDVDTQRIYSVLYNGERDMFVEDSVTAPLLTTEIDYDYPEVRPREVIIFEPTGSTRSASIPLALVAVTAFLAAKGYELAEEEENIDITEPTIYSRAELIELVESRELLSGVITTDDWGTVYLSYRTFKYHRCDDVFYTFKIEDVETRRDIAVLTQGCAEDLFN